jgi:hypothetical protein
MIGLADVTSPPYLLPMKKNANGPRRDKAHLPEKPCAACTRPFTWRKKWARDWENVRFCSDACRASQATAAGPARRPRNVP